ncbi:MAG: sodium/solute symporter [Sedimentisphaerales bacterium]|nr:sodium/solute symporter [Sedimentisphaerales bacterium]
MQTNLGAIDICILILYGCVLVGMGIYYVRKCRTADQFMVAGRSIPAWAAGLAVMSAYTSSISYIATPGMAYDSNWHPMIFALCILPVAWLVCKYAVPYYRQARLISVYSFLEERLGPWGRIYAALSFLLYMVGRTAVILYLVSLLISKNINPQSRDDQMIMMVIVIIGLVTIIYTLLGGMEAVIWTDVMQSVVMIVGIVFCAVSLSMKVFAGPEPLINAATKANMFSLGSTKLTLASPQHLADRTIWVMIIYGITENLRNLLADQNYVQKYSSVPTERAAKRSIWIAMLIYIPLTAVFLYIGTTLFAFYSQTDVLAKAGITKGDEVFPHFIATEVPPGLKGLIIAAIVAAAMSTVDSALNCSATVMLLDFHKRYFQPNIGERASVLYLRLATVVMGLLGIGFAVLMIRAESALNLWWKISGIFGGGILGLFVLSLLRVRLRLWQGLVSIAVSIAVISWGTFMRDSFLGKFNLQIKESWKWAECNIDDIIIGAMGTAALMVVACIFGLFNRKREIPA